MPSAKRQPLSVRATSSAALASSAPSSSSKDFANDGHALVLERAR